LTEQRALLDAAEWMDSPTAVIPGIAAADVRGIAQRFLSACYTDLGKVPRLLDGDDLAVLLRDLLPRHFGVKDDLAVHVEPVLRAYLGFLRETALVPAAFELGQALDEHSTSFRAAVDSGSAHPGGAVARTAAQPRLYRGTKVGRNDPCPCGSGKKFKKCCKTIGE